MRSTQIDERVPARVLSPCASGDGSQSVCDLFVERFMGVLVHPVPPVEMQKEVGVFQSGEKILVYWPEDRRGWPKVIPGDRLEVEERMFTILAIRDFPVCYSEVYVAEE